MARMIDADRLIAAINDSKECMTVEEAINRLFALQGMIEWDEPMYYATAIDKAIEALAQADKYKWHDLRKDPTDLPNDKEMLLVLVEFRDGTIQLETDGFYNGVWLTGSKVDTTKIAAWKRIEPFEEEK